MQLDSYFNESTILAELFRSRQNINLVGIRFVAARSAQADYVAPKSLTNTVPERKKGISLKNELKLSCSETNKSHCVSVKYVCVVQCLINFVLNCFFFFKF